MSTSTRAVDIRLYDRETRELISETCRKLNISVSDLFKLIGFEEFEDGQLFPCKNCIAYGFDINYTHVKETEFESSYFAPGNGHGRCSNHQ